MIGFRNAAAIIFTALALSACVGSPLSMPFAHNAPTPAVEAPKPVIKIVVKPVCLKSQGEWSAADLTALHDALVPLPDKSPIIRAIREWFGYRAENKACSDAQK